METSMGKYNDTMRHGITNAWNTLQMDVSQTSIDFKKQMLMTVFLLKVCENVNRKSK